MQNYSMAFVITLRQDGDTVFASGGGVIGYLGIE